VTHRKRNARKRRARVGAEQHVIEKRDPIPPGVYWLDVFEALGKPVGTSPMANWRAWLKRNESTVRVLSQETHFDQPPNDDAVLGFWVLFRVSAPTKRWDIKARLALPTVAFKGEETRKPDTESANPPESIWQFWRRNASEFAEQASKAAKGLGSGLGLLLLLFVLSKKE
jgi:hypothetical protein